MADKQLILAVEGTAAMGPFWQTVVSDYLEKIIRSFCGNELTGQKPSARIEFSLVVFNTHGSYSACLVQRSGWTRDVDIFLQWLSAIPFTGGGFNDAAIAEGLAEALMMFTSSIGTQIQHNVDGLRHCILVASSNPYPLPTPVYRPQLQKLEQSDNVEVQTESRLSDAETVAKSFAQCSVSLSVICTKQLPRLKAIYNAGKRNPRGSDLPVDNINNPHFLVLISENFMEARASLSKPGMTNLASNPGPVKMDVPSVVPVSVPPPTSIQSVTGPVLNRQPIPMANTLPATVKVESSTVTSLSSGPAFSHIPSVARAASQGLPVLQTSSPISATQEMVSNNESMQDVKPAVGMTQSLRPANPSQANVNILNNLSQARQVMNSAALTAGTSIGRQSTSGTLSNMISSGMTSSVAAAQTVISSGQSAITSATGSGTLSGTTQVMQTAVPGSFTSATPNTSGVASLGVSQPMVGFQGSISIGQSVPVISQGSLSGPQTVQNGVGVNANVMSGMGQSGMASANGTMIPTPGMLQQAQPGSQSLGVNNNAAANMPLTQQSSSALPSAQSKYVRVWEGNLSGQRQGQPVFITRLEGYRSASASETLAANWPNTMQIVRLISQDHMNNKQYVGKADFLVFRAMNQHGFLGQLQEKKLCAVIQLPSQTLLLSVSDKACRLIGMLFPGDMVVFKPQISNQQQQQQQLQQQHPQLQHQQLPQLQQLQQQQQQSLSQLHQQQPHQQLQTQQPLQQMQSQQPLQQLQPQQSLQQMQSQQPLQQLQQQQSLQQLQQQQPLSQMQQQPPNQMPQQPLSQMQQQPMPQMLQQQQQQQQPLVGSGISQSYVQGPGRSQLVSQAPVSAQVPSSMPGGGFLN